VTTLYANSVDTASSRVFTGGLVRKPASAIAIHLADKVDAFPDLSPKIGFRRLHDRDTRRDKSEHVRVPPCVSTVDAIKEDECDEKV
jgi:hypothetical protein